MIREIRSIGLMLLASLLIQTNAYAEQVMPQKPAVYSYWAGWSNEKIPHTQFNGLILAFAMLRSNGQHYYTDYKPAAISKNLLIKSHIHFGLSGGMIIGIREVKPMSLMVVELMMNLEG